MPVKWLVDNLYSDDEDVSESSSDSEDLDVDNYKEICRINQEEMNFFNDIANVPSFLTFNYKYPKTDHWNKPQPYDTVRSLFYKYVDNKTLDLIHHRECNSNHVPEFDYNGIGNNSIPKEDIDILFVFAERWCDVHDVYDIFWVASCIVHFSCI